MGAALLGGGAILGGLWPTADWCGVKGQPPASKHHVLCKPYSVVQFLCSRALLGLGQITTKTASYLVLSPSLFCSLTFLQVSLGSNPSIIILRHLRQEFLFQTSTLDIIPFILQGGAFWGTWVGISGVRAHSLQPLSFHFIS